MTNERRSIVASRNTSDVVEGVEVVTTGIADAVVLSRSRAPSIVIDWKSDIAPTPDTVEHYCAQVGAYLRATGAERGLIVSVTTGDVIEVWTC